MKKTINFKEYVNLIIPFKKNWGKFLCYFLILILKAALSSISKITFSNYITVLTNQVFVLMPIILNLSVISGGFIFSILEKFLRDRLVISTENSARQIVMKKLLEKHTDYVNNRMTGSIMDNIKNLTHNTTRFLSSSAQEVIESILSSIITLISMFLYCEARIFQIILVWFFIVILLTRFFSTRIHKKSKESAKEDVIMSGRFLDLIKNIELVIFFRRWNYENERVKTISEKFCQIVREKIKLIRTGEFFSRFLFLLLRIFILLYFSMSIGKKGINPGSFLFTIICIYDLQYVVDILIKISNYVDEIGKIENSIDDIFNDDMDLKIYQGKKQILDGSISLQNVYFSYHKDKDSDKELINEKSIILKNITLSIKKGEKVAIIGSSGSGKSTLLKLITGLYKADKGNVLLSNRNINEIQTDSILEQIAYLPQDTKMFYDTLKKNLLYGKENSSVNDVTLAAEQAQIHKDILKNRDGYDLMISDSGTGLSGGQRQRAAIARMKIKSFDEEQLFVTCEFCNKEKLYKFIQINSNNDSVNEKEFIDYTCHCDKSVFKPLEGSEKAVYEDKIKIVLMDEFTSALDHKVESKVLKSVMPLFEKKTVLIITHRLSCIDYVNRVIIIKDGELSGDYDSKEIKKNTKLYQSLFGFIEEEDKEK
jgi:ABC-type multidrug transport system fused ATPase/permease subunit